MRSRSRGSNIFIDYPAFPPRVQVYTYTVQDVKGVRFLPRIWVPVQLDQSPPDYEGGV